MPSLLQASERALITSLSIESVAYTLVLAEQHGAANLKAATMRYVTANGEAVTETEGWTYLEQAKPSLGTEVFRAVIGASPPASKRARTS